MNLRRFHGLHFAVGLAAAGALAATSTVALAQHGSNLSRADRTFAKAAAQGGMAEVKLGRLAVRRGASERVRQFGQRMIDDHSKANDKLKDIASREGVPLPGDISPADRAEMDRLERLHGAAFDSNYVSYMRTGHRQAIADFRREARNGRDPDIKGFASDTLPTIREHYAIVSRMQNGERIRAHRTKM